MANSYTLLADLKAGRCSNTAELRLLRFWEARNVKKGGELMSVDMLLLDEKSTLIQGSIGSIRQLRFRNRLSEGSVYALSGFDVSRSNPNFRLSDEPLSIRFNDGTSFDKLPESVRPIPTELFRFRSYNRLLELANTGKQLPDILGELTAIRSTITDRIPGAQRVMLTLRLQSGESVCVSLFDYMALAFHTKFDSYGKEPRIVLATGLNPKIVGGNRVFVILPGHGSEHTSSSSKVVHAQKIEPMTVSELNQFVITSESQIIEFLCTAKVTGIDQADGWCYIGCSVCSKKLLRETSSFTCVPCNVTNAVAALRYRVTLSVSDSTDTASFLGFDIEMAKLTNILASEASQIVLMFLGIPGIGADARVDTELPQALAELVGKTYTFQLKLNDFNFTSKHQTFTISRIFPERALAPLPAFVVQESGNNPDEPVAEAVAPDTSARVGTTCNDT
uniref:Replication factor A C-terminal domain-containing protein n=1 Tax=Brassica oleracea TaxID=3712 RepID=A0A3P6AR34_BRAOL|nr:unnamed protein product [Brassica oleracea]